MHYIFAFFISFFLSVGFTFIVRKVAIHFSIIDLPKDERKIHKKSIPLLGGMAVFLSFFLVLVLIGDKLLMGDLYFHHWLGVFLGSCLLMMGGFLDDKYDLKPKYQFTFAVLAALCVIFGGVEIQKITNPLGGFVDLNFWKIPTIYFAGVWHYFVIASDVLIFIWLLGMMYTTKLLDGVDGLVTGVVAIGAFIIFLFTITTKYYQPDIALASLVLCGACAGFLIFNWHPASIFLGEGGSLFLGFILGVLAIISGGKIAIALLVMGIPIMDVIWIIIRRMRAGKNPFQFSDRKHLHHRLLDLGIGQRKTVIIFYIFSTIFGLSALFAQSQGKAFALVVLVTVMLGIISAFRYLDIKNKKNV